jgi:hypothetical protein
VHALFSEVGAERAAKDISTGAAEVLREVLLAVLDSKLAVQTTPTFKMGLVRVGEHAIHIENYDRLRHAIW